MSFEEKNIWAMAVITPGTFLAYLVVVCGRAQGGALSEVAYQWPMVTAIGVAILVSILAHIAVAISAPEEADKKDERDAQIGRHGGYVGSFVITAGALAALVLAMAEVGHFWIANAIYAGFALADLTGSAAKICAYRRGF